MVGDKPRMVIFNRADQADPAQTAAWKSWFRAKGCAVLETDAKTGKGVGQFSAEVRSALKEKIAQWKAKGQVGPPGAGHGGGGCLTWANPPSSTRWPGASPPRQGTAPASPVASSG